MKKILVTGGTVFVSRFVASYFAKKGNEVYVLNRNSRPQLPGVTLIEGDRNDLGDKLKAGELQESAAFAEQFAQYKARYAFPEEK